MTFSDDELAQLSQYLVSHAVVCGESGRVFLDEGVALNDTLMNTNSGEIHVGAHTVFGHRCMILTGRHNFKDGKRDLENDYPREGYDIRIGAGCVIGSSSIICGGVTIGDNCYIGAGAVVTRDIPSGMFAAGVPARAIKPVSEDATCHEV